MKLRNGKRIRLLDPENDESVKDFFDKTNKKLGNCNNDINQLFVKTGDKVGNDVEESIAKAAKVDKIFDNFGAQLDRFGNELNYIFEKDGDNCVIDLKRSIEKLEVEVDKFVNEVKQVVGCDSLELFDRPSPTASENLVKFGNDAREVFKTACVKLETVGNDTIEIFNIGNEIFQKFGNDVAEAFYIVHENIKKFGKYAVDAFDTFNEGIKKFGNDAAEAFHIVHEKMKTFGTEVIEGFDTFIRGIKKCGNNNTEALELQKLGKDTTEVFNTAGPEETYEDNIGFNQLVEDTAKTLQATRLLKQEQEWTFQQCLEEDQRKEAEKHQMEVETKQKEEETKEIELAKKQKEEEVIRKKEEKMKIAARQLPPEPAEEGLAGFITMKVRDPNGEAFVRRFASTDKLSVLQTFLESIGYDKQEYKAIVWPNTDLTHPSLDSNIILDHLNLASRFCIHLEEIVETIVTSKIEGEK